MINDLVARMFALRDNAHLAHWATASYAQHMALGELYDSIPGALDKMVESYQGCYGKLKSVKLSPARHENVLAALQDNLVWIEKNASAITHGDSHLLNLLDGISEIMSRSYYKLKNLS